MNEVDARSRPVYGGYHGEFRKVHRAAYETVCVNGKPQIFPTAHEAELAAWHALRAHLCGDIVRSGERAAAQRGKAEVLFGAIFKRGRKIEVVRR